MEKHIYIYFLNMFILHFQITQKIRNFYSLVFLKTLYNNQSYVSLVQINHINSMLQFFQNVKNNVITKIIPEIMLQCIIN